MKFLSIFSANRNADGKTRYIVENGDIGVEKASELFGISEAELTPTVRAAIAAMTGEISELRTKNKSLLKSLENAESMADHDALVPLFNRRAFVRELSRLIAFARRYGLDASVIYFDLDGFKSINDTHGHAAGDKILLAVAEVLIQQTRESDLLGRLGGDEFIAVLTSVKPSSAREKAAQLADEIRNISIQHEGKLLSIDASFGVTTLEHDETAEIQIARSDEAMYAAKLRRKAKATSEAG
ncbi:GGDEF domain-containing protein [Hirschia baltica]|uniref:diguanylate cyclase n=1 Tax=Hirschia baltica (strain ATCC 49814 / DSM 5838 / IFAM 1418) TaxID=582402 RepID=C6XRL9_HIRBI|nr:GGDEF domain-containing protein [Hirschia baltica]ACT60629.1 diguanylate cyclase [Hirschia baltica ATCC 49814]